MTRQANLTIGSRFRGFKFQRVVGVTLLALLGGCKPRTTDSMVQETQEVQGVQGVNRVDEMQALDARRPLHKILTGDYLIFCSHFISQKNTLGERETYVKYLRDHRNDYCASLDGFDDVKYQAKNNTCCLAKCPSGFNWLDAAQTCYKGYVNLNENRYRISKGVQTINYCAGGDTVFPEANADFVKAAASATFEKQISDADKPQYACKQLESEWIRNPYMSFRE